MKGISLCLSDDGDHAAMTAISAIPSKSFGIGILGNTTKTTENTAKNASRNLLEAAVLLGFLRVGPLKPAKHWDLIGIYPSDPQ
jgi:hypothetical protein